MVLTGKQSLDFSGGVSAEDNFGIGGYDRVMGPNGQAQYWAPNLGGALRRSSSRTTTTRMSAPGESGPRRAEHHRPARPRRLALPARPGRQRLHDGRRHLLRRDQPRPQEGVRHPHPDARGRRPGPRDARALGRHGRRRDRGRPRRPPRWNPGAACWGSSRSPSRDAGSRPPTAPTSTRPAPCSRSRRRRPPGRSTRRAATARSSCSPTCPGSTGHRTRCAACSSSTAPRSAGPSSTSTGRSSSPSSRATTVVRSWCSPRRSTRG